MTGGPPIVDYMQLPLLREAVRMRVLGARTMAQVIAAEEAVAEWLAVFPDDDTVRLETEQLAKMRGALEYMARQAVTTP